MVPWNGAGQSILRSLRNTSGGERVWDIYAERSDGTEIDPDEYARVRAAIDEVFDIESGEHHLIISDGYDGNAWKTAPVSAPTHRALFSIRLMRSL